MFVKKIPKIFFQIQKFKLRLSLFQSILNKIFNIYSNLFHSEIDKNNVL